MATKQANIGAYETEIKGQVGVESALNTNSAVPPAVPQVTYCIVVDGKSAGPFAGSKIQSMIASGQIERDSLIWKQGMPNWEKIKTLSEFSSFFSPDLPDDSQH